MRAAIKVEVGSSTTKNKDEQKCIFEEHASHTWCIH